VYVEKPPDTNFRDLFGGDTEKLIRAIGSDKPPGYVHWDKLRHLDPPGELTAEQWWWAIKVGRESLYRPLPMVDINGRAFTLTLPDGALRLLHFIDQRCSGEVAMAEVVTADDQAQQHYLVNSLMEEATRSSQLEGATTTRRVAKELLRSGRTPRNRSERMILNNYHALQFMRAEIGDTLTPALVLELQRILTTGTIDPESAGRLQRPDEERVAVFDRIDGSILHQPPPADELELRLQRLCDFANASESPEQFMHPVVRAILIHFGLAYDHPFEDGNGRTARALFYWSMRSQGYWLTEYLSISSILRKAPGQYTRAFLLSETDDGDTTYFVLYQLGVIKRAVDELHTYLRRKTKEVTEFERTIRRSADFNHRQLAVLSNAIRNPEQTYTFQSHGVSHNITHETARRDLLQLADQGLLDRRTIQRRAVFRAPVDLAKKLTEGS
jgi:Fic family protein